MLVPFAMLPIPGEEDSHTSSRGCQEAPGSNFKGCVLLMERGNPRMLVVKSLGREGKLSQVTQGLECQAQLRDWSSKENVSCCDLLVR